jgi:hypothetical protein
LKNYFVAVILTGLILALAFNHLAGSQTSPSAQYDPWADLNDDGKISMDEIVRMCELFGTTGDPTKNVIIAGYHWSSTSYEIEIPASSQGRINITTTGYRQITIHFYAYDVYKTLPILTSYHYLANVSVGNAFVIEKLTNSVGSFYLYFTVHVNEPQPSEPALLPGLARTYSITGPMFIIGFCNYWNNFSVRIRVEVYLTT